MRRLAARTGLPAIAGILDGAGVLLVLSVQGNQHLQLRSAEGTRNPWHATSMGRALAPTLPPSEAEDLLAGELPATTSRTVTDPEALREDLARVRALGRAEVDEENEVGIRSVAAVAPDPEGSYRPRLAVSLGAAVVLTSRDELHAHVPALLACTEEIASLLG